MEPLSILSAAGNVLQFLEFTVRLVRKGRQYTNSADGALIEHRELQSINSNLSALSSRLRKSVKRSADQYGDEGHVLEAISRECQKVAQEFAIAIAKLQVDGSPTRWKSFRYALKSIWNRDQIEEMAQRLDRQREQLAIHLLMVIR